MSTLQAPPRDPSVQQSLAFLQGMLGHYRPRDFAVRFWDGSQWDAEPGQPVRFTLVLRHPGSLRRMFFPPSRLRLAEAHIFEDYDIEGDIEAFWDACLSIRDVRRSWPRWEQLRKGWQLFRLPSGGPPRNGFGTAKVQGKLHSRERDREAVTFHYNVSNDFYALWLDPRMLYSCAYFHSPGEDIDIAQEHKLDHICRKLRLQPGDRLLDIGCGWGALTLYAAQHYGARVVGVTISQPQADMANDRLRQAGLADRARVEVHDYRDIREPEGFDKVAAIGILEHVGDQMFPTYFRTAWDHLKPGGVFLSHGIALGGREPMPRGKIFATKYVFPDGELLPLHKNLAHAEKAGWEVRDVESLREHYVLTLRHWVRRLEARADEARRATDELRYRIYRAYMSMSAVAFKLGRLNIYQTLLAKPDRGQTGLPLTRADWYA